MMSDNFTRKTSRVFATALLIGMVVVSGVFLMRFPDAPVHRCIAGRHYLYELHPDGFCGKQGQARTADDYAAYNRWGTTLEFAWPLGMAALIILHRHGRRSS